MPNEVTAHRTGNDILDLKLIDHEILAAFICIIAYIILIISAKQDREVILLREKGIQKPNNLNPSELAAISSSLVLLSSLILGQIAFIRKDETANNILSGVSKSSIIPNINITNGYSLTIIGSVLKTLGAVQRAQEQKNITIL